jgi:ABC-2 type transport system ATP-binding protein
MAPIIHVDNVSKTYASGFNALKSVSLSIDEGEIFALLGPNGAGKTTLISTICGIVTPTSGRVTVAGHDIITNYKAARSLIGLVPQELTRPTPSRRCGHGQFQPRPVRQAPRTPPDRAHPARPVAVGQEGRKIMTLSGGMKRRVLIAKASATSPRSCSSTSRRRASMSSCAATCGRSSAGCATRASPSS